MDKLTEEITQNIKKKRKEKKMTQGQLAEAVGVKDNTVSTWESGINAPSLQALYKICKALNISISELFGKYANEMDKGELSPKIKELLKRAEDLNEEGQERLFELSDLLGFKYKKD